MTYAVIIQELKRNKDVFNGLLKGLREEEYVWKTQPEKWRLLEIVCHLYDEEREDFRTRLKHVLESRRETLPAIDPPAWVTERKYMQQNYADILDKFMQEREESVLWLQSLKFPEWNNAYDHPQLGRITGNMFLANWLAHDYLHIRQIIKLKFDHLKEQTGQDLTYAGEW